MSTTLPDIIRIYQGSDAEATKALYAKLESLGGIGSLAVNLFRAQKASERAKVYSRRFKGAAYDKKQWSIDNLCGTLEAYAAPFGLTWGWGEDDKQPVHKHVVYIDLSTGQVSFHSGYRGKGPDYPGQWDGIPGQSPDRIMRWVARVMDAAEARV
jgi:hypothetical protein